MVPAGSGVRVQVMAKNADEEGCREVLSGGCNDIGGTLMEETISRMAGSQHGSYKSISVDGGFKINNLMGLQPKAMPEIVLRAVIDREVASSPMVPDRSSEVVELD